MSIAAYYNDSDAYACGWLQNLMDAGLITPGFIDNRPIQKVRAKELRGYDRVHLFAGIGGWERALNLAGWGDAPIWTGSCPCQPFSAAGNRKGTSDERAQVWDYFYLLVAECEPDIVVGEQVASPLGREWISGVQTDVEALGFAFGAADLPAAGVGAPHIRQRLWWTALNGSSWMGDPDGKGIHGGDHLRGDDRESGGEEAQEQDSESRRASEERIWQAANPSDASAIGVGLDDPNSAGFVLRRPINGGDGARDSARESEASTVHQSLSGSAGISDAASARFWEGPNTYLIPCLDGKARRVESGIFPLAYGLPESMDGGGPIHREKAFQGIGNAIVPQVGAEFVRAIMDITDRRS